MFQIEMNLGELKGMIHIIQFIILKFQFLPNVKKKSNYYNKKEINKAKFGKLVTQ